MDFMLIVYGLAIVGAMAILATMTPNKTDNKVVLQIILDIINMIGANVGKAKNK